MRMLDGLMSTLRYPGRRRQGRMGRDEAIACALMAGRCSSCSTRRAGSADTSAPSAPAPSTDAGSVDEAPAAGGSVSACCSLDFVR